MIEKRRRRWFEYNWLGMAIGLMAFYEAYNLPNEAHVQLALLCVALLGSIQAQVDVLEWRTRG